MNLPIPAPDTLPAAWGWFQALLMLVFPIHLLLMNAMLGFALLSLYSLLKGGKTDLRLAHELARALPILIALAVNFGVAALLFLQVIFGQFFYTSSVLMAVFWLGVPAILLVAYYAAYVYDFRFDSLGRAGIVPISLASALFLAIAFLFTGNMTLMIEPLRWSGYFTDPGGTLLDAGGGRLWARYLHFLTSGLAVGGLSVAVFGRYKARHDAPLGERAVRTGMHSFTMLTLLQLGLGVWYLVSLPRPVMLLFMGGSRTATALLLAGLALTVAALAAGFLRRVALSACLAVPLVYVMAFLRDAVRSGSLKPFYAPETLPAAPEHGPLLLFLASLALGAAVIAWMVRKAADVYRDAD
jgi:hypothetical protein